MLSQNVSAEQVVSVNVGGTLLLELNRVLRPGGYFVWSATPVYQKLKEDAEIWKGWCIYPSQISHFEIHFCRSEPFHSPVSQL